EQFDQGEPGSTLDPHIPLLWIKECLPPQTAHATAPAGGRSQPRLESRTISRMTWKRIPPGGRGKEGSAAGGKEGPPGRHRTLMQFKRRLGTRTQAKTESRIL